MSPRYQADGDCFVIEDYNSVGPFSSFFPALAGEVGKPMWLFYTNRGQAVSSFGVNNKDGAMLEFLPANKAYQATPHVGFRTFLSFGDKKRNWFEPFSILDSGSHQKMYVRPYELEIVDESPSAPVSTAVSYLGVPGEPNAVLARRVTITNKSNSTVPVHMIDGLPRVVPYGMNDYLVKHMSRTIEAFAEVGNLKTGVPFFKLKIEPSDRPELIWLDEGFFSFCLSNQSLVSVIVDPTAVFGPDTAFQRPTAYFSINGSAPAGQLTSNILPSSLFAQRFTLGPKQSKSWVSYFGHASSIDEANNYASRVRADVRYFDSKRAEMKRIYEDLAGRFGFQTALPNLNNYANVSFMDNVLRGGFPLSVAPGGPILHLYSRKHGDMERDYNHFQISATAYSQGNGNFRDVNQNRRHDLYLNPDVATVNLDFFFNLIQLDGFNPLVINPILLALPKDFWGHPELKNSDQMKRDLLEIKKEPVLAGQLYEFVSHYASDPLNVANVFRSLVKECQVEMRVQHGEGFWVDHWTYNLDHLDQYLAVFPDRKTWILFEKDDFTFYDSDHFVQPRREKYVITPEGQLRQYKAVVSNPQKQALIASRAVQPNVVRTENGQGPVFETTLFVKLVALATVKASSLDPFAAGLEMEADRPGWCDALNGLPGIFGSSTHEMFELQRLVQFLLTEAIPVSPSKTIELPTELFTLIRSIDQALVVPAPKDFRPIWDKLATAREVYREEVFFGLSGKTRPIRIPDLKRILVKIDSVLESARRKASDSKTGIPTSYFSYGVDVHNLGNSWRQYLSKLNFTQHRLVPFLEGPVHAMKGASVAEARRLHRLVQRSKLYDKKLGMYKLNAPLEGESTEIGRIRVFAPGWLENESIFLHMHYKYLLQLLRSGLNDEFEKEIKKGLICFREPKTYGRSIFENSSFIASSSFPDPSLHGRGFVARLSGATSELMSMIYHLFFGAAPFKVMDQGVIFSPDPTIPAAWFGAGESGETPSVSLKLFGVPISYVMKSKGQLGPKGLRPVAYEWILDGRFHNKESRFLPPEASLALREGRVESLTIFLGKPRS